jgi:hypothetical protein
MPRQATPQGRVKTRNADGPHRARSVGSPNCTQLHRRGQMVFVWRVFADAHALASSSFEACWRSCSRARAGYQLRGPSPRHEQEGPENEQWGADEDRRAHSTPLSSPQRQCDPQREQHQGEKRGSERNGSTLEGAETASDRPNPAKPCKARGASSRRERERERRSSTAARIKAASSTILLVIESAFRCVPTTDAPPGMTEITALIPSQMPAAPRRVAQSSDASDAAG